MQQKQFRYGFKIEEDTLNLPLELLKIEIYFSEKIILRKELLQKRIIMKIFIELENHLHKLLCLQL